MKLYVDYYCEIANILLPWTVQQFYGFEKLTIEPDAIYIVGRIQLRDNAEQIRRIVTERTARVIFSNPAEGSETFVQHLRLYGVEDLVLAGLLPVVVGGAVPDEYPHILYEHFLTQPFRYEENCQAANRIGEIFEKTESEKKGISNCPLCALGNNTNKTKIWVLADMDADHVSAWSKGGATDIKNCEMLCKTHNRAKGNK